MVEQLLKIVDYWSCSFLNQQVKKTARTLKTKYEIDKFVKSFVSTEPESLKANYNK